MDDTMMLEMLKIDLGISTNAYDPRLTQCLQVAAAEIAREGITLDSTSMSDANLQVIYAAWLWRKRIGSGSEMGNYDTIAGMPRMLRWLMNNRLFEEKTNG